MVVVDPNGPPRTLVLTADRGTSAAVYVRGEAALVLGIRHEFPRIVSTFTVFDVDSGSVLATLDEDAFAGAGAEGPVYPLGIGGDGTLLFGESNGFVGGVAHWLVDGVAPRRIEAPDAALYGQATPIDLVSSAEVLFRSYASAAGAYHDTLSTSAARIDGVCPAAATSGGGSGGGSGCQIDGAGGAGAWPLAVGVAVWAATRRRGGAGAPPSRC